MNALLKETGYKSVIIVDQKVELERLCSLGKEPTATNDAPRHGVATAESEDIEMEVDAAALDHVVENVIDRLLEPVSTPLGRRRASLMPPPPPTQQPLKHKERKIPCLSHPSMKLDNCRHRISIKKDGLEHWWNNTTNGSWLVSGQ
jgi:hypothetical protein